MDLIAIGKIRSTHGVHGFLKVISYSGETRHFFSLKKIIVEKNASRLPFSVEQVKPSGSELLIKLAGVDSPEEGKKYSGCVLFTDRKNAAPVKDGEYYHADLCSCVLVSGDTEIGKVISVWNNGYNDYLEIKSDSGKTFMVPFMKQYVGKVNLKKHTIELLDDGIIE